MTDPEQSGKSAAVTAYILLVGALIALSMNSGEDKQPFASFHIRQALGLSIVFISLGLLVSPFDNWIITSSMYLFVSVFWAYGLFGAASGKQTLVPVLGPLFQKMFKNI